MARKTDGEKIDELEKLAATLVVRVDSVRKELDDLGGEMVDLARSLTEIKTGVVVLQRDGEELRRDKEQGSARRRSLLPPVISAVLSGIISATVAYFVARK